MKIRLEDLPDDMQAQVRRDLGEQTLERVRRRRANRVDNKHGVAAKGDRTWNGRTYASRAEMLYAQRLWTLRDAGEVIEYIEQPRVWLGVPELVTYLDFFIVESAGVHYVDVKGFVTPKFRKICQLWQSYGRHPLHVVRREKQSFRTSQVILPRSAS